MEYLVVGATQKEWFCSSENLAR